MQNFARILVFLILSQALFGQSPFKTDSVYRLYYTALKKNDSTNTNKNLQWLKNNNRANDASDFYLTLAQYDNFIFNDEKEKAFTSCMKATQIATQLACDSLIFKANYKTGCFYMELDNLVNALQYFNKCLLLIKSVKNINDQVYLYKEIALLYSYLRKNDLAIEYFLKMEPLIIKTDNKTFLGNVYNNIGINYVGLKNFSKALFYYRNSLAIRLEINDGHGIAQVTNNIGTVYYEWKQYNLALEYYLKGKELRQKANVAFTGIIESNTNIGKTYNKLNQTAKAIQHHRP